MSYLNRIENKKTSMKDLIPNLAGSHHPPTRLENNNKNETYAPVPAAKKLRKLPAVKPATRHKDMNPPAASRSSGST